MTVIQIIGNAMSDVFLLAELKGEGDRMIKQVGVIAVMAVLAGCVEQPQMAGQRTFLENCSVCHGRDGAGNGEIAADLPVPPADLTRISEQAGGAFPYDKVMATIYGYPGKYNSSIMPEFGPLLEGEQVSWTDGEGKDVSTPRALMDLVLYLETIQKG